MVRKQGGEPTRRIDSTGATAHALVVTKWAVWLFCGLVLSAFSLKAGEEAEISAVTAADDVRIAATLSPDGGKLDSVLSTDLHYCHSSGAVDTKPSLMTALVSGRLKYLAYAYEDRHFTAVAPGIILMTGRTRATVANGAAPNHDLYLTYLAVWRKEDNAWRLLTWHSGSLPLTAH